MTDLLSTQALTVGYPGVPEVLRDVDLTLRRGARLALLGANGSGKSTLLRCLAGSLRPASGAVLLEGRALGSDKRSLTAHRQVVQLVLQDPDDQLFATDVRQDVAFGPTNLGLSAEEVAVRVEESLAALDVAHLADRPVHHLSFGQRKRVALAGVLAMRPAVLLLDEPTAGLDPAGVQALLRQLARLERGGVTIMLSTHQVDLAWRWSDEVAILRGGRLHQGEPAGLLTDGSLMAAAGLDLPWQASLLAAAGVELDPARDRPREVEELVALLGGVRHEDATAPGTA